MASSMWGSRLLFLGGAWATLVTIVRETRDWRLQKMHNLTPLDLRYIELRNATLLSALDGKWPDQAAHRKLARGLTMNGTRVFPRKFDENGPLQATAFFFPRNTYAVQLLEALRAEIFDPFTAEVLAALSGPNEADRDLRDRISRGIYAPDPRTFHLVLTVFSEHSSLLDGEEQRRWRPVSDQSVEALAGRLVHAFDPALLRAPTISFQGLCLTLDGSMIATFNEAPVDASEAFTSVGDVRKQIAAVGRTELGHLNSRPKNLIHVSLGRFLDWPHDVISAETMARVGSVVAKYTRAFAAGVHPRTGVAFGPPSALAVRVGDRELGRQILLTEVELCRDTHWMMVERRTYKTYTLQPPSPTAHSVSGEKQLKQRRQQHRSQARDHGNTLEYLSALVLTFALKLAMGGVLGWALVTVAYLLSAAACPHSMARMRAALPNVLSDRFFYLTASRAPL